MTDPGGHVAGWPVPVMPPRRSRWERVQVNARVRVEVEQTLQRFVREQYTTVQDCVDLALAEFLTTRGYAPDALSSPEVRPSPAAGSGIPMESR